MELAKWHELTSSVRKSVAFTFANTTGDLVDLGLGRSLVGFEIPVGLADGSMTFAKGAGGDDENTAPAVGYVIQVENDAGAAQAAYTVDHSTTTDYHPVDAVTFRGARWIALTSSADQAAKVVNLITEPT